MKITKVTSSGINRLIDAYKASMNSQSSLKFGSKQAEFFENTEISIFLSDVKGIELITLRKWCSSLIVIDSYGESFNTTPAKITKTVLRQNNNKNESDEKRENDLNVLSEKIVSLNSYIQNKTNLTTDLYGMFDIGSYRFRVIARFEGVNIMALLNAFPEYLLFDSQKREFKEEGSKAFENLCGQQFIKNFYSYMETMLSGVDVLSDVRFEEEFLKYTSPVIPAVCTHIRNPFLELKMNTYPSADGLIRDMRFITTESRSIPYNLNIEKDFTYHFAINSSIETLILLLAFSNVVYHYSDLKTIIGIETDFTFPKELNDECKIVYKDAITALDKWRLNALKELTMEEKSDIKNKVIHYSRLELYNFIPRASRIKYMVHGTEEDFNALIKFFEENKPLLLNTELKEIFNCIKGQFPLIHAVYNMV